MWRKALVLGGVMVMVFGVGATIVLAPPPEGSARRPAAERGRGGPRAEVRRLQGQIDELLAKAERLEVEGHFEDAKALREKASDLKRELGERPEARRGERPGPRGEWGPGERRRRGDVGKGPEAGPRGRRWAQAPDRMRQRAERLEAEGQEDAAQRLRQQADRIEEFAQKAREHFQRGQELRAEIRHLDAEARELRDKGEEDAAARTAKKAESLEGELRELMAQREKAREAFRRRARDRAGQMWKRAERPEAKGWPEPSARPRWAAGRPEEHLAKGPAAPEPRGPRGERARRGREGARGPAKGPGERPRARRAPQGPPQQAGDLQEQMRGMRNEVRELRQEIHELRQVIVELRRSLDR